MRNAYSSILEPWTCLDLNLKLDLFFCLLLSLASMMTSGLGLTEILYSKYKKKNQHMEMNNNRHLGV